MSKQPNHLISRLHTILLPRFSFLIGLAAFLLYSLAAAPGIVELFDDTLEFQVVGPTFGIAHPTGYPLYILLSGIWSRVLFPVGEWAWRMNLFSALMGGLAVGLTAQVALRLSPLTAPWRELVGLAAALLFGLGPVWWSQSTEAEVYSLHLFFVALILHQTLAVIRHSATRASSPQDSTAQITHKAARGFTLLTLYMGLALAHHRTIVLLLPAIGLVLLWRAPHVVGDVRRWPGWAATLLTPLALYLWIPLRASMGVRDLHGSYENSWAGFWDHVLARRYLAFFSENPLMIERSGLDWLQLFVTQLGGPALFCALVGLALYPAIMRRIEPGWVLITLTLTANLIFSFNYRVGDVEVFLLPAFLCLALLASMGLGVLVRLTTGHTAQAPARTTATRAGLGAALLILGLVSFAPGIGGRGTPAPRTQEWGAHDYAYLLATVDFPPDSRVIGLEGEITALRYMQLANGLGENAEGIVANLPEQRQTLLAAEVSQGRAVYITRELEGIQDRYRFVGSGPLIRVLPLEFRPTDPEMPPVAHPIGYDLEGAPLRLEAAEWTIRALPSGPRLELLLDWRLTAPTPNTYKLSLRLLNPQTGEAHVDRTGEPIVADVFPLRQVALTWQWPTNFPMRDVHYLPWPTSPTDPHRLQMIVYDAQSIQEVGRWEIDLP